MRRSAPRFDAGRLSDAADAAAGGSGGSSPRTMSDALHRLTSHGTKKALALLTMVVKIARLGVRVDKDLRHVYARVDAPLCRAVKPELQAAARRPFAGPDGVRLLDGGRLVRCARDDLVGRASVRFDCRP